MCPRWTRLGRVMTIQWSLRSELNYSTFGIAGDLAASDSAHLDSATTWVLRRCSRPVILDICQLLRLRPEGETILGDCITRLTPPGVVLYVPEHGLREVDDPRVLRVPMIHNMCDAESALRRLEWRKLDKRVRHNQLAVDPLTTAPNSSGTAGDPSSSLNDILDRSWT